MATLPEIHWFNTGRKYTEGGQIICYTHTEDGHTLMADLSRIVDYEFEGILDKEGVLHAYDHNLGKPTTRSWEFLAFRNRRSAELSASNK